MRKASLQLTLFAFCFAPLAVLRTCLKKVKSLSDLGAKCHWDEVAPSLSLHHWSKLAK